MPRSAPREAYSRRHRFAARGAFAPALRSSRKLRGRFAIIHVATAPSEASRLGIALTRRLVPEAVDRNRVKRLVRETFRRHAAKHAGFDCVVALRGRFDRADEGQLVSEIRGLLDRLCEGAPA
jgi:ribonuclease P protein component